MIKHQAILLLKSPLPQKDEPLNFKISKGANNAPFLLMLLKLYYILNVSLFEELLSLAIVIVLKFPLSETSL